MVIILAFFMLFALGVWAVQYGELDTADWGAISLIVGAAGLFICSVTLTMTWVQLPAFEQKVLEMQRVADVTRAEDAGNVEGAAWRLKVAEINAEIAEIRYYNGTVFDIWWNDRIVERLEPIQ